MGVPRSAARRLAAKARTDGIERKDTSGSLRRYLDHLYWYNDTANSSIYVWSEKVFIFVDQALVTVLNLPTRFRSTANNQKERQNAG